MENFTLLIRTMGVSRNGRNNGCFGSKDIHLHLSWDGDGFVNSNGMWWQRGDSGNSSPNNKPSSG